MANIIQETAVNIGGFLSKFLPFPAENIGLVIVIALALFLAGKITSYIPPLRDKTLPWIGIAGALFYLGWFY